MFAMIGRCLVSICIACWLSVICRVDGFVSSPSLNNCIVSTTQLLPYPSKTSQRMKGWKRDIRRGKKKKPVSLNASTSTTYDMIVIGGGSAGLTAAKFAATFDKSVCLVESNKVGGDWKVCTSCLSLFDCLCNCKHHLLTYATIISLQHLDRMCPFKNTTLRCKTSIYMATNE